MMEQGKFSDKEIQAHALNWQMPEPMLSKDQAWEKLQLRIATSDQNSKKAVFSTSHWLRLAAVIAVLFAAGLVLLLSGKVTVEGSEIGTTAHLLPCGSKLTLADGSHVTYNKYVWPISRQIVLNGKAHFNVETGSRFEVSTPRAVVEVLGTIFSVWSAGNRTLVHCEEGSVRVIGDDDTVLKANEFVYFNSGSNSVFGHSAAVNFVIPGSEILQFENTPIELVCAALATGSEVEIKCNLEAGTLYTGSLDPRDIRSAVEIMAKPFDAKIIWASDSLVEIAP